MLNPGTALDRIFKASPGFYATGIERYNWPRPAEMDPIVNVTDHDTLVETTSSAMQQAHENVEALKFTNLINPFNDNFLGPLLPNDWWEEWKGKVLFFGGAALLGIYFLPSMLRGMGQAAGKRLIERK